MRRSAPRADQASRTSPSTRASRPSIPATASRARAPWSRLQWRPRRRQPPLPEGERAAPPGEPDEQDAAEAQTAIYNQDPGGELELGELELEPDPQGAAHEDVTPEEHGDDEAAEPPIETLDTVEHELPEHEPGLEAPPSEEPVPEQAAEPEHQDPSAPTESEETSEESESPPQEDVLADTPEFLRDAPEDDELWFEQGKPKDFDF